MDSHENWTDASYEEPRVTQIRTLCPKDGKLFGKASFIQHNKIHQEEPIYLRYFHCLRAYYNIIRTDLSMFE